MLFQAFTCFALFFLLPLTLLVLIWRVNRLWKVPGPLLCRFTDLPRAYQQNIGQILEWLALVHQKYGTVVCIGPNTVSVSDATKVPSIYTMHGDFKKADSYQPLRVWVNGASQGSIIDMQDEKVNADMKRSLRGAFSIKNVLEFDDEVDKQILALKRRIQEDGTVALMELFAQYQVDFFSRVAFGETSHFLEERTSTEDYSSMPRLKHWQQFQGFPWIEHLFYQTQLVTLWHPKRKPSAWATYAGSVIQSRKECVKEGKSGESYRKDLLDKYLQAQATHPQLFDDDSLLKMVSSTVSAGFDSTPYTMNNIIFYLCKNPRVCEKLREEIMDARGRGNLSDVPKWTEVNKLPYLDAVMKEAMRLAPFLNLPLERTVPRGGIQINDLHLPTGTTIGCHSTLIGRDRAFYGNDADEFLPERWFSENRIAMERNSLTFGSGKRMCLGLHIAELEIKKTIPVIIRDFKMEIDDQNTELVSADGLTSFPQSINVHFHAAV